uniref:Ovule protein n=1 Tax=Heterorhabditis bacteriophora TaxID=37862 RepID=A0A1I7XPI9_HETBA
MGMIQNSAVMPYNLLTQRPELVEASYHKSHYTSLFRHNSRSSITISHPRLTNLRT